MEIMKEIGTKKAIIIIIPNNAYTSGIIEITRQISKKHDNILYVSLNKLNNALKESLKEKKVDLNKVCFVDAITKSAVPEVKNTSNCIFLESASSLTKLSIEIGKVIENRKIDVLFFDSLSTLLMHQNEKNVTNFTQFTVNKLGKQNVVAIFTVLKEDTEKGIIKNIGMFVDGIIPWEP